MACVWLKLKGLFELSSVPRLIGNIGAISFLCAIFLKLFLFGTIIYQENIGWKLETNIASLPQIWKDFENIKK